MYDVVLIDTDTEILSRLTHHMLQHDRIALILHIHSLDSILPYTQQYEHITLFNPHAGLNAFAAQGKWNRGDLDKAIAYGFTVYDPYCVENLFDLSTRL